MRAIRIVIWTAISLLGLALFLGWVLYMAVRPW
jgi:hypothetical protein